MSSRITVKAKGFRFSFRDTRILFNFGYHSGGNYISIKKGSMIPHVIESEPEKGFIEMSSFTIWLKKFCLIITKYKRWRN